MAVLLRSGAGAMPQPTFVPTGRPAARDLRNCDVLLKRRGDHREYSGVPCQGTSGATRSAGLRRGRGWRPCGRGRRRRPGRSATETEKARTIDVRLTSVVQPARRPMIHDSTTPATTPTMPPAHEISVASSRNWRMIVAPPRADRPAHADLARPLEDAGEHDVHDADAADEQRDRRDRDHHQLEDPLRAALLGQQLGRHDQREVVGAVVRLARAGGGRRATPARSRPRSASAGRCRRSRPGAGSALSSSRRIAVRSGT